MSEFTFHRVSAAKLKDVIFLLEQVYKEPFSIEELERKHQTLSFGAQYIGYIAYDEMGQPAATYSVLPMPMRRKGVNVLAAQGVDALTIQKHQRKGLFVKIVNMTHDLAKHEGLDFVYIFPSTVAAKGFVKKIGFENPEAFQLFEINFRNFGCSKKIIANGGGKGYFKFVQRVIDLFFKPSLRILENSAISGEMGGMIHDDAYFKYKWSENKFLMKVKGRHMVIKVINNGIQIGDIERTGDDDIGFISSLKLFGRLIGTTSIKLAANSGSYTYQLFAQHYTPENWVEFIYLPLNENVAKDFNYKFGFLDWDDY